MTGDMVEVRCPSEFGRLLLKISVSDDPPVVVPGNLMEIACPACRRVLQREGRSVSRVLHRYNFLGELVETVTEST
jgi:hypothetical protein